MEEKISSKLDAPKPALLELAMNSARNEVLNHADDLSMAGISFTPEQLQSAANLAAERVRKEHLAKESTDPLVIIENTLQKVAETDEEKSFALAGVEKLREFRRKWQQWYQLKQRVAQAQGRPFDLNDEIRAMTLRPDAPSFVSFESDTRYRKYHSFNPEIAADFLAWRYGQGSNVITVPNNYMDRVTAALVPMLNGLSLREARAQQVFPLQPQLAGKPYLESESNNFKNLPGLQEGIAFIAYDYQGVHNRLAMIMGVDTLQKIIDFTPSAG